MGDKKYLKEYNFHKWQGWRFRECSILKSPFYLALIHEDRKIYDEYRDSVMQSTQFNVCTYEDFIKLYESIRDFGYDPKSFILLDKRHPKRIIDGQHRAAILLFIDENVKVRIDNTKKQMIKAYPIFHIKESLTDINGKRPSEIHTIIAWDGEQNESSTKDYVKNELKQNFEIVYQDLIEVNRKMQMKLAKSVYGKRGKSRVKNDHLYLVVVKDTNPIYEWQRATSCEQVLNVNMKFVKEDMREKIGGSRNAYFSIHTSYNTEEALLVLEPLNLQHLIDRPTFDNFGELFEMLNNDDKLEYLVQRSFHELENSPSFFKSADIDILVNDYYYFKSITGARSVYKNRMRENDNGINVRSKINIGGIEVPFDIRFTGDNYVDSVWERDMLNKRTLHILDIGVEIFIPNENDELYSLLYHILVQKMAPEKSKHIPRVKYLLEKLKLNDLDFEGDIDLIWDFLKVYMTENGYSFKKPVDTQVGFRYG